MKDEVMEFSLMSCSHGQAALIEQRSTCVKG